MSTESPQSLSASIVLGLSANRLAPIAPVGRRRDPAAAPKDLHPSAPWRRALVLFDPAAPSGRASSVGRELQRGLEARGVPADLHLLRGPGDACARLAALPAGTDLVVCAGDPSSLREVLLAVPGPELPVGFLPLAGALDRARARLGLDLPVDVDGALEALARRRTRLVPLLRAGDDVGLSRIGVGRSAAAARAREQSGFPWWAAWRARRSFQSKPLSVRVDGRPIPGLWHEARIRPLALDRSVRGALAVRLRGPSGRASLRGRSARVEADRPLPIHADGRFRGLTPLAVEATAPRRFVVP